MIFSLPWGGVKQGLVSTRPSWSSWELAEEIASSSLTWLLIQIVYGPVCDGCNRSHCWLALYPPRYMLCRVQTAHPTHFLAEVLHFIAYRLLRGVCNSIHEKALSLHYHVIWRLWLRKSLFCKGHHSTPKKSDISPKPKNLVAREGEKRLSFIDLLWKRMI